MLLTAKYVEAGSPFVLDTGDLGVIELVAEAGAAPIRRDKRKPEPCRAPSITSEWLCFGTSMGSEPPLLQSVHPRIQRHVHAPEIAKQVRPQRFLVAPLQNIHVERDGVRQVKEVTYIPL